jgi:hypothetical protein
MKEKTLSYRILFCFIFCGLTGVVLLFFLYDAAFPEASLDLRITKDEARSRSHDFIEARGFDLTGYRSVVFFEKRQTEVDYLERHLGLEKAGSVFSKTVAAWRWKVRWFKELEETEYTVDYASNGRTVHFNRALSDAAKGARLERDIAHKKAEEFLTGTLGLKIDEYDYLEHHMNDHPNRMDYIFVWRLKDFDVGGAKYRHSVAVQGDQVAAYHQYLKIPETWSRKRSVLSSQRQVLGNSNQIFTLLLQFALLGVFFWQLYQRTIRWKSAFVIAATIGIVSILGKVNNFPLSMIGYYTSQSLGVFWGWQLLYSILGSISSFCWTLITVATAESLGRKCFDLRPTCYSFLPNHFSKSIDFNKQVIAGYSMGLAAIGYVTLFYVVGQKLLGVWTPVDVPISNSFSSYFPSFHAIETGLSAAIDEEFTFRLFAIALLFILTKKTWLSILLPAIIWGFAHTFYPQEPIWIRGLELSIAGIVYGWIFFRFGLVTTLVSHFTYNCVVGVIPLFQSNDPFLLTSGVLALLLPFLLIAVVSLYRRSSKEKTIAKSHAKVDEPAQSEIAYPAFVDAKNNYNFQIAPTSGKKVLLFLALSIGLAIAGQMNPPPNFFGKPPTISKNMKQATERCNELLLELGGKPDGFTSFTDFTDDTDNLPGYVIDTFGSATTYHRYLDFYVYRPTWRTRWFKEGSITSYDISIDDSGHLRRFRLQLPDTEPGARLPEAEVKQIALRFLKKYLDNTSGEWKILEVDKYDKPNRWDYSITFEDSSFSVGKLKRRLSVSVSGDRISNFNAPYYKSPADWQREQSLARNQLLSSICMGAGMLLLSSLVIFSFARFALLLRQRYARKEDIKWAAGAALCFGVVPNLIESINQAPQFFSQYFGSTEQSLWLYSLKRMLAIPTELIATSVAMFSLFFCTMFVLRAWGPSECQDWKKFIVPLHPRSWGKTGNLQAIPLGIGAWLVGYSLDIVEGSLRSILTPYNFNPSSQRIDVDLNFLLESLDCFGNISVLFATSAIVLVCALTIRRFVKREFWIVFAILIFSSLVSFSGEKLGTEILFDFSFQFTKVTAFYFLITRILRWNLMAYMVWIWFDLFEDASLSLSRYWGSSSEFLSPAIQQVAWLVLPILAILIIGIRQRRKQD